MDRTVDCRSRRCQNSLRSSHGRYCATLPVSNLDTALQEYRSRTTLIRDSTRYTDSTLLVSLLLHFTTLRLTSRPVPMTETIILAAQWLVQLERGLDSGADIGQQSLPAVARLSLSHHNNIAPPQSIEPYGNQIQ